jgi:hypothetical protein
MNTAQFDALTKRLGTARTRRSLLTIFAAGIFGSAGAQLMTRPVPAPAQQSGGCDPACGVDQTCVQAKCVQAASCDCSPPGSGGPDECTTNQICMDNCYCVSSANPAVNANLKTDKATPTPTGTARATATAVATASECNPACNVNLTCYKGQCADCMCCLETKPECGCPTGFYCDGCYCVAPPPPSPTPER